MSRREGSEKGGARTSILASTDCSITEGQREASGKTRRKRVERRELGRR